MIQPHAFVARLEDVALAPLWAQGFRGLILDLDNTLCAYGSDEVPQARRAWIAQARQHGFSLVILSNNFPERVAKISALLDVPALPNALKPLPFAYLRALRILGVSRQATLMIGDQLLTDILGARCVGVEGILTDPIVAREFPLTHVLRFLEKRFLGRDVREPRP